MMAMRVMCSTVRYIVQWTKNFKSIYNKIYKIQKTWHRYDITMYDMQKEHLQSVWETKTKAPSFLFFFSFPSFQTPFIQ